jgi:hypothetical protein
MIKIPDKLIIDSTKLKSLMTCPRQYFYEHVLGWRMDSSNLHLVFGEAYHKAQEVLLLFGYTEEAIDLAYLAFNEIYREHFSPITDSERTPKIPIKALEAIQSYVEENSVEDANDEVLFTEISGTAPISPTRVIHYKLDSVIKRDRMIISREHKTTGQDSKAYHAQWDLSVQVGTYLHFLFCMYPQEDVRGIQLSTTFFYKAQKAKFHRRFITRTPEAMNSWLQNVNYWYDFLEQEYQGLASELKNPGPVMESFPMNTESCTKYNTICPYHDFCIVWPNPIVKAEKVPFGFHTEFWDPREKPTTNKIDLFT